MAALDLAADILLRLPKMLRKFKVGKIKVRVPWFSLFNNPGNLDAAELTGRGISLVRILGVIAILLVSG